MIALCKRCFFVVFATVTLGNLHAATEIRIEGLEGGQQAVFSDMLMPRMEYIRSRPPSKARAEDAAFILQKLLRNSGYSDATVSSQITPAQNNQPDIILLRVELGEKIMLGNIHFAGGVPRSWPDWERIYLNPIRQQLDRPWAGVPYIPQVSELGDTALAAWLREQGHLDAKVNSEWLPAPNKNTRDLKITVDEGELYHLAKPTLENTEGEKHSLKRVLRRLRQMEGSEASTRNLHRIRFEVLEDLRKQGFEFATVQIITTRDNHTVTPHIHVDTGLIYEVGKITFSGAQRTQPGKLHSLFSQMQGSNYNANELRKTISRLIATGAFQSVRPIITQNDASKTVDIEIQIEEARSRGLSLYAGLGSVETFIVGSTLFDRNLLGSLYNATAIVEFSGLGLLGEIGISDPFFLNKNIRLDASLQLVRRTYESYNKNEAGSSVSLVSSPAKNQNFSSTVGASFIDLTSRNIPFAALGQDDYLKSYLKINHFWDERDNPTLPTKGFSTRNSLSFIHIIGTENSFPMISAESFITKRVSLSRNDILAIAARGGILFPFARDAAVPIDERFFIGGPDSVRSFPFRGIGPRPEKSKSNVSIGGQAYWVANAEYIRRIYGPLHMAVFYDVGSLAATWQNIAEAPINHAIGVGILIDLPIGPARFEYGHNMSRRPGEPWGSFHFAIGIAF